MVCGECVARNLHQHPRRNPLHGCDGADAVTELNWFTTPQKASKYGMDPHGCYLPETDPIFLESLHRHYPNATLILNRRDPAAWLSSVNRWNGSKHTCIVAGGGRSPCWPTGLRGHLTACKIRGLPSGVGSSDHEILTFYNQHTQNIRAFARSHPSLTLVEVEIDVPGAADKLAAATGIRKQCWGEAKNRNAVH